MSFKSSSGRGRIAQVAKGLAAAIALGALVVGIPYLLCRFVGWPLPRHVPTWHGITTALGQRDITDTTVVDVLAIALWICWAVLALAFIVEAFALARSRSIGRLPIAGRLQPLAGALLGTAVLTFASLVARPTGSGAGLPRAAITVPVRPSVTSTSSLPVELTAAITNGHSTNGAVRNATTPRVVEVTTYTVRDGDTLWGIAERQLGDAAEWKEIFDLNRGVLQAGGGALEHPHWIYPGWQLRLPVTKATSPTVLTPPPTPSKPSSQTAPSTTTVPTTIPAMAAGPVAPGPSATPDRTEPTDATTGRNGGATGPVLSQTGEAHAGEQREPAVAFSPTDRVGGGLVVVILGALVALRLRRRQRYRPRGPKAGRDLRAPALTPALAELLAVRRSRKDDTEELGSDMPAERPPLSVVPDSDARATPDRIEVAMGDGDTAPTSIELSLGEWPGLVVSGAGAESTVRAWCAALLARGGPYNVEFVMTTRCAARLFAGLDVGAALRIEPDSEAVCARIEAEFIARARQLEVNDVDDAATYRLRHSEDPFPCLVAILDDLPTLLAGRWRALTDATTRFGGVAVLLEAGGEGSERAGVPHLVVDDEGRVEQAIPAALGNVFIGRRCLQLGVDAAADLLAPVVAVHNYAPSEDGEFTDLSPDERWPTPIVVLDTTVDPMPPTTMEPEETPQAPVRVRLLGPAHIEAFGEVVSSHLRGTAFDLLAWFALRPDGATRDAAADALFPDATVEQGSGRFWTALGNLRSRLGKPKDSKDRPLELIAKVGDRYVPDAAALDIDLWRFEASLAEAAATNDIVDKSRALDRALSYYRGDFCPGIDDLWCEPAREDLHRRALDAAFRLAELTEHEGDDEATVAAWERVIALDPIAEAPYRRFATLLAERNRNEQAIEVGRRLIRNLAAIELEPTREIGALFAELRVRQRQVDERRVREERQ
jgi:DNA-binding SARP family transcriptional activator/LysM repeat protein